MKEALILSEGGASIRMENENALSEAAVLGQENIPTDQHSTQHDSSQHQTDSGVQLEALRDPRNVGVVEQSLGDDMDLEAPEDTPDTGGEVRNVEMDIEAVETEPLVVPNVEEVAQPRSPAMDTTEVVGNPREVIEVVMQIEDQREEPQMGVEGTVEVPVAPDQGEQKSMDVDQPTSAMSTEAPGISRTAEISRDHQIGVPGRRHDTEATENARITELPGQWQNTEESVTTKTAEVPGQLEPEGTAEAKIATEENSGQQKKKRAEAKGRGTSRKDKEIKKGDELFEFGLPPEETSRQIKEMLGNVPKTPRHPERKKVLAKGEKPKAKDAKGSAKKRYDLRKSTVEGQDVVYVDSVSATQSHELRKRLQDGSEMNFPDGTGLAEVEAVVDMVTQPVLERMRPPAQTETAAEMQSLVTGITSKTAEVTWSPRDEERPRIMVGRTVERMDHSTDTQTVTASEVLLATEVAEKTPSVETGKTARKSKWDKRYHEAKAAGQQQTEESICELVEDDVPTIAAEVKRSNAKTAEVMIIKQEPIDQTETQQQQRIETATVAATISKLAKTDQQRRHVVPSQREPPSVARRHVVPSQREPPSVEKLHVVPSQREPPSVEKWLVVPCQREPPSVEKRQDRPSQTETPVREWHLVPRKKDTEGYGTYQRGNAAERGKPSRPGRVNNRGVAMRGQRAGTPVQVSGIRGGMVGGRPAARVQSGTRGRGSRENVTQRSSLSEMEQCRSSSAALERHVWKLALLPYGKRKTVRPPKHLRTAEEGRPVDRMEYRPTGQMDPVNFEIDHRMVKSMQR